MTQISDAPQAWSGPRRRDLMIAAVIGVLAFAFVFLLSAKDVLGRPLPLSALLGVVFGIVLQRGRFCFWCNFNDFLTDRNVRGLMALVVALAAGTAGYAAILHGWMPDPFAGRLPPDAFVGPIGLPLVIGALAFGLGMALSGSCVSAHLYRLGEGSIGSIVTLVCVLPGLVLGYLAWPGLYGMFIGPVVWLPGIFGHGGALALALAVLAVIAWALLRFGHWAETARGTVGAQIFHLRWPPVVTGLLVAMIGVIAYLRVAPLGVTAEIASLSRTGGLALGLIPERISGLDTLRGCIGVVKDALWSRNGVFIIGMILGAAASARIAGQVQLVWPSVKSLPRFAVGGLLLGFGAMLALGCTVGVLMSGTMAGSLSGWGFAVVCFGGAWLGKGLRKITG